MSYLRENWFPTLCIYAITATTIFVALLTLELIQWETKVTWTLAQKYFWINTAQVLMVFTLLYFAVTLILILEHWLMERKKK